MGLSRCSGAHSLDSASLDSKLKLSLGSFLKKMMIWELGLSCFLPKRSHFDQPNSKNRTLEQNKTWLLAESVGGGGAELTATDPQSVHSSFRFSLCSQVEVDTMNKNPATAATILMVNLGSGLDESDGGVEQQRRRRIESLEKSIVPLTSNTLIKFTYTEILSATHHFSKGRVLGRGAWSYVFRGRVGVLRTAVAIKRLDKEDKESSKAFCRELMIASSLRHPNVVPLIGFCIDAEEGLFLVYKYVSGGSLERHLHGNNNKVTRSPPLPWSMRYKIGVGISEAIAHLHYGTGRCVVHRDIKPSNILLSSNKNPKLCDFGLASWTPAPSVAFLCKTVKGTFGYLAPEYFQHGKVSGKTDVYAFGVVLLELITGRKPVESRRPPGEENLVLWAKPLLQKGLGAAQELLDPRIKRTSRNSARISRMIEAAAACINSEESRRPSITEIVAILRGKRITKRTTNIPGNNVGYVVDYPLQLQQTNKSEMNNHVALAMLGSSEISEDDLFYWQ